MSQDDSSPKITSSQDIESSVVTIPRADTFDSSVDNKSGRISDVVEAESSKNPRSIDSRREFSRKSSVVHHEYHHELFEHWCQVLSPLLYISAFSVIGTTLRVYIGRLLGHDCVLSEHGTYELDDFFAEISTQVCVTSDGKLQRGGALFVDLPANMIGSFIMGLISPSNLLDHPLPWFRADHPLQHYTPLLVGLKVGLCGCLTTFASWNTQMVVMLDGTNTEFGPQVASAIFGYIIGAACALSSFVYGQQTYNWLVQSRSGCSADSLSGTTSVEDNAASSTREAGTSDSYFLFARLSPLVIVAALFCGYAIGDDGEGGLFYRRMWMVSLVSPLGAALRWRLSAHNNSKGGPSNSWFPWGTFTANAFAAIVSVAAEALHVTAIDPSHSSFQWASPALLAIEIGFAGSLSTVSTLVREMVFERRPGRANFYCTATILCSMLLGLMVYSPIIRHG